MQLFIENSPNVFDSDASSFINIIDIVAPILFDSDWSWTWQSDGATNMVSEMVSSTRIKSSVCF